MKKEEKKNKLIIGALLITIALMTIGYAALAAQITLNTGNNKSIDKWNISYQSITKNTTLSSTDAIENEKPTTSGTAFTYNITLPAPGSKIVYDLVIENTGTIDATFKGIVGVNEINATLPTQITCSVKRLNSMNGKIVSGTTDLLNTNGKNYFRVTIEWLKDSSTSTITSTTKSGTIYLDYVQKQN